MFRRVSRLVGVALLCSASAQGGDWASFRGPTGLGIGQETNVPTTWGPDKNVKWKAKLPGPSNSSPIVSNGCVFVTCATNRGGKRNLYCFDRNSGEELWVRTIETEPGEATHKSNPYCGSTPVADGTRVVVWHGSAGLYCYDFKGNKLWSRDLGNVGHMWGYGSSPVIFNGRVLLHFGPGIETFLVAVDMKTGKTIWQTDEPGGSNDRTGGMVGSWSTPIIAKVAGKDQIICSMPTRVVAYEPESGEILWTVGGLPSPRGDLVYTSVIVSGDLGVAMGGYKGPAIGFKLGGAGDVTKSNRLWKNEQGQPQRIGSGVIIGKHIFMANAGPGTAQCINLETGKEVWKSRLPGNSWGSLTYVDGKLFVTSQNGATTVFRPNTSKFDVIATNPLGEPSNASPAFSNGNVFLRTNESLYCIGK